MKQRRKAWAAALLLLGAAAVWIPWLASAIGTTETPARPDVAADSRVLHGESTSAREDPLHEQASAPEDRENLAMASGGRAPGRRKEACDLAPANVLALAGAKVGATDVGENRLERALRAIERVLPPAAADDLDPLAPAWRATLERSAPLDRSESSMPGASVPTPSPASTAGATKSAQKQQASEDGPQQESKP